MNKVYENAATAIAGIGDGEVLLVHAVVHVHGGRGCGLTEAVHFERVA